MSADVFKILITVGCAAISGIVICAPEIFGWINRRENRLVKPKKTVDPLQQEIELKKKEVIRLLKDIITCRNEWDIGEYNSDHPTGFKLCKNDYGTYHLYFSEGSKCERPSYLNSKDREEISDYTKEVIARQEIEKDIHQLSEYVCKQFNPYETRTKSEQRNSVFPEGDNLISRPMEILS